MPRLTKQATSSARFENAQRGEQTGEHQYIVKTHGTRACNSKRSVSTNDATIHQPVRGA